MGWYSYESISGAHLLMCGECYVTLYVGNKRRVTKVAGNFGNVCINCNKEEK